MQHISFLSPSEEPLDALCYHMNVLKPSCLSDTLPATIKMRVIRDSHLPTHVVALTSSQDSDVSPPLFAPIHLDLFSQGFRSDLSSLCGALPSPRLMTINNALFLSLPVVSLPVPHVPSMPLLLLFALKLERQPNTLASRLLPPEVIEEFPNAAAMAQVLARIGDDEDGEFERRIRYNQGLWQNVLALGVNDSAIVGMIKTIWNVTAEARRIRSRSRRRSCGTP